MSTILQKAFNGGMNLLLDDSQLAPNEYVWIVNARNRFGFIEPVRKPVEIFNLPAGVRQGLIAVNDVLIVFVAGKAYYNIDGSAFWIQIPNFQMSTTAAQFFSLAIPASTFNFKRLLDIGENIHAPIRALNTFKINGTPAGILVQDGETQPWIIEFDSTNQIFTSRVTKNYAQWQNQNIDATDREYVPIGLQMMILNQTLFIVAPDRHSVYRSITGRPLDFMVNVDVNGNKLPSESDGGASSVSFAMDFDEITCIQAIDIPDSFVYATKTTTRFVTADYNLTIFGEPTFRETVPSIRSGMVNQYCFAQSLGDYVQIDFDGIKTFNAVKQLKFKGANDIFSKEVSKLFFFEEENKPIRQQICSIINFNNYLVCNLDTIYGNILVIYDTIVDRWVGLDISEVTRVKQFAIVETFDQIKLYAITHEDRLFYCYGSLDREVPYLRVQSTVPIQTNTEHKSLFFRPMFNGGTKDGEAVLRVYTDDQENYSEYTRQPLKVKIGGVQFPVIPPVIPSTEQRIENPSFSITKGLTGKKLWFTFAWTNDSKLVEFMLETSEDVVDASQKQKNESYGTTS